MAGRRKRQKNCPAAKGQDRPMRASPPYVMTACAPFYIPRGETPLRGAQKGRFFLYMVLLYPINAFCNSAGWKNYQNFKYPAKFCRPLRGRGLTTAKAAGYCTRFFFGMKKEMGVSVHHRPWRWQIAHAWGEKRDRTRDSCALRNKISRTLGGGKILILKGAF